MVEKLQRFYRWTWWQLVLAENRSWLESWPILSKRSCTVARFVFPLKTSIVTKNAAQGISMHRNHFTFEVGSFSIIALGSTIELIESIEPFSLRSTRNILSVISSVDTWKAQFFLILSINFKIESNIYIYFIYNRRIRSFNTFLPFPFPRVFIFSSPNSHSGEEEEEEFFLRPTNSIRRRSLCKGYYGESIAGSFQRNSFQPSFAPLLLPVLGWRERSQLRTPTGNL